MRKLEQEIAALQDARGASAESAQATQAALVAAFTSAAERIEGMAKKLNARPASANEPIPRLKQAANSAGGVRRRERTTLRLRGCGVRLE